MDGIVRFNKAFFPDVSGSPQETYSLVGDRVERQVRGRPRILISHKTNDPQAEDLARHTTRHHGIVTYLAVWDLEARPDSLEFPEYIMRRIQPSQGFLVSVRPQIAVSMWVGYEIGGAHAHGVPRAKTMFSPVSHMPSVVEALERLRSFQELDSWVRRHVLRVSDG